MRRHVAGDGGGDELDKTGRPKILKHKNYFDPEEEPFENERDTYAPLVWQCRYGGVEVPDDLWRYVEFGKESEQDKEIDAAVKEFEKTGKIL